MILKSMSRNSLSFKQLINYLDKEDSEERFSLNMYADKNSNKELIKEFMENAKNLHESRGKIYLYHEIISLEDKNLDRERIAEILRDLANIYIHNRAKNHLVFGVIHNDTDNPHIHLIISSNEAWWSKRVRLSKNEFARLQRDLESYKNEKYKELEQIQIYNSSKAKDKTKNVEQEIKHKRKNPTIKELVREKLQKIFSRSLTQKALENTLKSENYELYTRWKTNGVIYEWKKYRFSTLGLDLEYKRTLTKIKKRELRREKWGVVR